MGFWSCLRIGGGGRREAHKDAESPIFGPLLSSAIRPQGFKANNVGKTREGGMGGGRRAVLRLSACREGTRRRGPGSWGGCGGRAQAPQRLLWRKRGRCRAIGGAAVDSGGDRRGVGGGNTSLTTGPRGWSRSTGGAKESAIATSARTDVPSRNRNDK